MVEPEWTRWQPYQGALSVVWEALILVAYAVRAAVVLAAGGVIFSMLLVRLAPRRGAVQVCGFARQLLRPSAARSGDAGEGRRRGRRVDRDGTPVPAALRLFALPRRNCMILRDHRTRRLQEAVVTLALVRLLGLTTTAAEVRTLSRFSSVPWILEGLTTAAGRPRREQMQLVLPAVVRGLALHRAWVELGSSGASAASSAGQTENQPLRRSRRVLYPRGIVRQKAALRAASLRRRLDLRRRSTGVAADLQVFRLYLEVIPALHQLAARPAVAVRFQKTCDGTVSRLQDRLHRYHPNPLQGGPHGRMERSQ